MSTRVKRIAQEFAGIAGATICRKGSPHYSEFRVVIAREQTRVKLDVRAGGDYPNCYVAEIRTAREARKTGIARSIMREVLTIIDRNIMSARLLAVPDMNQGDITLADLTAWYERLGFVVNNRAHDGCGMRREPSPPSKLFAS